VFVGVIAAEALSRHIPPWSAWLLGGALIGLAPLGDERPRSWLRAGATAAGTAVMAAGAHWLATLLAS
jgi:hypothetical protein